ncbi:ABC transporter substrate-binding protein [Naumannella halotolerans]|uniref:peptide ABC transporter substrate-binding protein n=1 Tax=Naumannella halotolerans TaxID=993414 RepID=UPI00370D7DD2
MTAGAVSAIAALTLAACGSGGAGTDTGTDTGTEGAAGGEYTTNGCTPENPLIASNTSEACGGDQLDMFLAKLVHYNTDTAEPEMDIAESIETDDNQTFTVTLKQGYNFHDGTEVQAHNFVDAWNWAAAGPNGQAASYFFSPIEGYADVQCGGDGSDCEANPPETEEMSGLQVVDDYTFTIKTTEAVSNLPVRLGYSAFAPQPDAFFADESEGKEDFAAKPIGAGPYQVESTSSTETVFTKFADYGGDFPGSADKITFVIYQDIAAAYADTVAGNLDVLDQIPTDQLAGRQFESDLPDRSEQRESMTISYLTYSPADEQLKENKELRQALSMAVDRETINQQLWDGARPPLDSWAPSSLPDSPTGVCGEFCTYDAAAAKALYDQSGGYDGTLYLNTNADGAGNVATFEAVCNGWKNDLGLDCQVNQVVDFSTYNKGIDADEYTGVLRSAWLADYPSIENYLAPIYGKGADSNWSDYDNPAFDDKLAEAAAAPDLDQANALYLEAMQILAEDFPTAPMQSRLETIGWSENVSNVKLTPFGKPDRIGVTVNQ